jgi:hypothetical protein
VNEVRSLFRVVKLATPPPAGCTSQSLLVPAGASDAQVLEWAAECLDAASLAELRARIETEASG